LFHNLYKFHSRHTQKKGKKAPSAFGWGSFGGDAQAELEQNPIVEADTKPDTGGGSVFGFGGFGSAVVSVHRIASFRHV
jgi:hypothetical protein